MLSLCALAAVQPQFWSGKRVLIAGASSGLGAALATELSSRGALIALGARRIERLEAVASACAEVGAPSSIVELDVTADPDVLADRAKAAAALLGGPLDALVYTAGAGQRSAAAETPHELHARLMATNFEGAVALTRAVLPGMLARGHGSIAVVSSVQGFFGQPYRSSYSASKAAMIGYFDSLRAETAGAGVAVTVCAPGYIATEHAANALGGAADELPGPPKGMAAEALAARLADAVARGRAELVPSQPDGRAAMLLRRLWPGALFRIMERKARA